MANKQKVFLNNNQSNVILEAGSVYEVEWPDFKTLLRYEYHIGYSGGYHFTILCPIHRDRYYEAHGIDRPDIIVYGRDQLRSAKFRTTKALNVLYGKKA